MLLKHGHEVKNRGEKLWGSRRVGEQGLRGPTPSPECKVSITGLALLLCTDDITF